MNYSEAETEDLERKRDYFLRHFDQYFGDQVVDSHD